MYRLMLCMALGGAMAGVGYVYHDKVQSYIPNRLAHNTPTVASSHSSSPTIRVMTESKATKPTSTSEAPSRTTRSTYKPDVTTRLSNDNGSIA
jgi:hypothetical protein